MSVLLIGADKISAMVPKMKALGVTSVVHWDTRSSSASKNKIPDGTDLVIFFTDYLHHSVAAALKKQVKSLNLPVLYSRRSWSDMAPKLQEKLDGY